ncbi:acyl-coenzyme A thioesterase 1-like isoform X2 [Erpetoichthys calabaricus]|nr:acyl-coenzyme A thioesterase 1-like isoform X2 [Erpetoichthys calabaricus]XP_051779810.1 acyl-coenzyme A thioesterase 1-like isoform X2 [Erpetoichthys calabaricus]
METSTICPKMTVTPTRGLVDENIVIVISGLSPKQAITIRSLLNSEDKDFWHAYGHYVSDDNGVVNVVEDECLGGTYNGREPTGLIWSLKPVPGSRPALRLRKLDVLAPFMLNISVYKGHISKCFEEPPLANAVIERWYIAPGVSRVDVKEKGIRGTLFIPPGPGPFPGILDMWGGGSSGITEYRSSLLASHGYAVLALDFLSSQAKSMQSGNITEKYFEAAFEFLQSHPRICSDRISIFGFSFGASVAVALVANENSINPRCLVCVSGCHIIQVKNTIDDAIVGFFRHPGKVKYDESNHVIWRGLCLPIPTDESEKVKVRNLKCPFLLIAGSDDQNMAAAESAEDIENMMKAAGNEHLLTKLVYPMAGHLIDPPYSPHIRSSNFIDSLKNQRVVLLYGGTTKEHCFAQEDSWKKILDFLHHHLYDAEIILPKV